MLYICIVFYCIFFFCRHVIKSIKLQYHLSMFKLMIGLRNNTGMAVRGQKISYRDTRYIFFNTSIPN